MINYHNKGYQYFSEKGVPQDYQLAAKEFRPVAGAGFAPAQLYLGYLYRNGQGVKQDMAESVKWYAAAAEQKHGARAVGAFADLLAGG
ncbi:MAG: hypothetical protein LBK60_04495 [Verrucomicrobiales bacterium]|nr:hypothetical protein [Verrucomicrobiales bacterium]